MIIHSPYVKPHYSHGEKQSVEEASRSRQQWDWETLSCRQAGSGYRHSCSVLLLASVDPGIGYFSEEEKVCYGHWLPIVSPRFSSASVPPLMFISHDNKEVATIVYTIPY